MTTKAKYSVKDFHTKSNNEKSTKMPLLFDKVDSGMHFMVKGIESRSCATPRLASQISYADMIGESESFPEGVDKKEFLLDGEETIKIELAALLITGWSFEEKFTVDAVRELLQENNGLSDFVIAHASTASNYFAKK